LFHDRIIERNAGQLWKTLAQVFFKIFSGADLRNKIGKLRSVTIEFGEHSRDGPHKHAGVPAEISFSEKRFGEVDIRLLAEANDAVHGDFSIFPQTHRFTQLYVAKTRARPSGIDADRHERASLLRCRR